MISRISDIFWDAGLFDNLPDFPSVDEFVLSEMKAELAFGILVNFEGMAIDLPGTVDVLAGKIPEDWPERAVRKVEAFGKAVDAVAGNFPEYREFSRKSLERLNKIVSELDIPDGAGGRFRTRDIMLAKIGRRPPRPELLDGLWDSGLTVLSGIPNPVERACAAFSWLAYTQFFPDGNKRTAVLAVNGMLVGNGFPPVSFPASDKARLAYELAFFHESGDATGVMLLMLENLKNMGDRLDP